MVLNNDLLHLLRGYCKANINKKDLIEIKIVKG